MTPAPQMKKRAARLVIAAIVFATIWSLSPLRPRPWTHVPAITVVGAPGDPRVSTVREAVDFWNRTLAELGSPFRLGPVTVVEGTVPEAELRELSEEVLYRPWWPTLPASLERFPGDLLVVLSDGDFISFCAHDQRRTVIGIKNRNAPLLLLPNVVRNVIAHELGHAIGLRHDADPAMLMCGRPAGCRPDSYQSDTPHFFPLSTDEKARLLALYPPELPRR